MAVLSLQIFMHFESGTQYKYIYELHTYRALTCITAYTE